MATHGNLEAFLTTVQEMGKKARQESNTYLKKKKNIRVISGIMYK